MNARAVAAWSAACLFVVLYTTNPAYKLLVLAATIVSLAAGVGAGRARRALFPVLLVSGFAVLLNFVSAHLGSTVLFSLPPSIPALGGPYTVEALAYGIAGGVTIGAAILAAAPLSLMLRTDEVVDALPPALSRTGAALAASLNLVPRLTANLNEIVEAQRLRGWRPRGPRSWAEVVVPVVLTSVEGSIQLAESMESRGYGAGPRTAMRHASMRRGDWGLVVASAVAAAGFVIAHALGWAADWAPYPTLVAPSLDPQPVALCLLLFAPLLAWRSRT